MMKLSERMNILLEIKERERERETIKRKNLIFRKKKAKSILQNL